MNLYLLVEGRRTERKLYRSWLGHCFPTLKEVERPEDLTGDSFFLISGNGYPQYLNQIPASLEDAARLGAVDHLFICVDAENEPRSKCEHDIRDQLNKAAADLQRKGLQYRGQLHVIVADCCIETWLLGHQKLVPRNPSDGLAAFKQFYDVSKEDPEHMDCPPGYLRKAHYHLAYLKALHRNHGQTYSKERPGIACEANYLAALQNRVQSTQHLQSFGHLWNTWTTMGANTGI